MVDNLKELICEKCHSKNTYSKKDTRLCRKCGHERIKVAFTDKKDIDWKELNKKVKENS